MIEVKDLCKEYVKYEKEPGLRGMLKSFFNAKKIVKKAVDNVNMSIKKGEIVGYIGANGAGKSTTIKMMTGILNPTSGSVTIDGIDPIKERKRNAQNIGVVFGQRTQLWWDLPLIESYTILKQIYGVSDADYKERMEFFDQVLGLNEFIKSPVRTLSLGQRMKADIAASLLHNPKVLFLDEPTIGLDVRTKKNLREAIKTLNSKYQTTVILTTHDLEDIEKLSDRIIMIDAGRIIYEGTLRELKDNYGYIKTAEFELREDITNIDFPFTQSEEDFRYKLEHQKLIINFNKHKIGIDEIVKFVLANVSIHDFSVSEMKIEDIVERIYYDKKV